MDVAEDTIAELEKMVDEGKIRGFGWSTDDTERAKMIAKSPDCLAIQQQFNLFVGNEEILKLCERENMSSINRGPLAMGILTGKFNHDSELPKDDVRSVMWDLFKDPYYNYFQNNKPIPELLDKLDMAREILTTNGRTPAQGALGWLWARSKQNVPITGFKSVKQVEENVKALDYGPITYGQVHEIEEIMHHDVAGI